MIGKQYMIESESSHDSNAIQIVVYSEIKLPLCLFFFFSWYRFWCWDEGLIMDIKYFQSVNMYNYFLYTLIQHSYIVLTLYINQEYIFV